MTSRDAERLADLIRRGLDGAPVASEVSAWRSEFDTLHFVN
jgi:glycine hydroxymethyltransferase